MLRSLACTRLVRYPSGAAFLSIPPRLHPYSTSRRDDDAIYNGNAVRADETAREEESSFGDRSNDTAVSDHVHQDRQPYTFKAGPIIWERRVRSWHNALYRGTQDPTWALLISIRAREPLPASSPISKEEVELWKPLLYASDITQALSAAQRITAPDGTPLSLPPWVVLYLVSHKVRTGVQAATVLPPLLAGNLARVPAPHRPFLLAFSILSCVRFSISAPLPALVRAFLALPQHPHARISHTLVLAALSAFQLPSNGLADLCLVVLSKIWQMGYATPQKTALRLLRARFATLRLTQALRANVTTPDASVLGAFVRVHARTGKIENAVGALQALQDAELAAGRAAPLVPPRYPNHNKPRKDPEPGTTAHEANTAFLNGLKYNYPRVAKYFQWLLSKDQEERNQSVTRSGAIATPVQPAQRPWLVRAGREAYPLSRPVKRGLDAHDWAAMLNAAASDRRLSAPRLRALFAAASPNIAASTIVARALLYRGDIEGAVAVYEAMRARAPLDERAVTIGLQVLARSGQGAAAFATLERAHAAGLVVPTVMIDELMVSLVRGSRPDGALALWDTMSTLYDAVPSFPTVDIMLKAARMAEKFDTDSRYFLTRAARPPPMPLEDRQATAECVARMLDLSYCPSLWRGSMPGTAALRIFRSIVRTQRPDVYALPGPANAVRHSRFGAAESPMRELASGLANTSLPDEPFDDEWPTGFSETTTELASYHTLTLTEIAFWDYFLLLVVTDRARDIPRSLVWMRLLGLPLSHRVHAIALVAFSEVSTRAPLLERGVGVGEFYRLRAWLAEWAGRPLREHDLLRYRELLEILRRQQSRKF